MITLLLLAFMYGKLIFAQGKSIRDYENEYSD